MCRIRFAPGSKLAAILLTAIVVIAAFLRVHDITGQSVWLDEAASWSQATAGSLVDVIVTTADDNYPPLHNIILWALISQFGDSELVLRLPSAVFGVLNVVAIYWVGTLSRGRVTGLLAALLLALSGFHIWYSQEARMYALLALTATLFAGTTMRQMQRPTTAGAALVVLSALALLYSHPYGALTWLSVVAAVGFVLWRHPHTGLSPSRWIGIQAIALAAFLPWAWILLARAGDIEERGFWIASPTPASVLQDLNTLANGTILLVFLVLAIAALLLERAREDNASLVGDLSADPLPPRNDTLIVLWAWAIGPIVLGIIASLIAEPIFLPRYIIGSLPAFLILAAAGMSALANDRISFVGVTVVAAIVSVAGPLTFAPEHKADWRSVAAFLGETYQPTACVLMPVAWQEVSLRYYYREPIPCLGFGTSLEEIGGRIPSDLVYVITHRAEGRTHADIEQGMLAAFPAPEWSVIGTATFQNINVVGVGRSGS